MERGVEMAMEVGRGRKAKGTAELLHEKVKARLRGDDCRLAGGGGGGGVGHEGCECGLSDFVDGFFYPGDEGDDGVGGFEGEVEDAGPDFGEEGRFLYRGSLAPMVRDLLGSAAAEDRFGRDLAAEVSRAVEGLTALRSCRPAFRMTVMSALREAGYNAGICTARWETHGDITGGSYEYIDVERPPPAPASSEQQRYIVDVEFAAEFDIARQTAEYGSVTAELPRVYVGRPEQLRLLLRVMAAAARRSLLASDMHVPPWRKGSYLQAKWLGPYRRTLNLVPSAATPAATPAPQPPTFVVGRDVKFRCVGFDAGSSTGQQVIPAAARA